MLIFMLRIFYKTSRYSSEIKFRDCFSPYFASALFSHLSEQGLNPSVEYIS